MNDVLFISSSSIDNRTSGAGQCTSRNYDAIKNHIDTGEIRHLNLYGEYLGDTLLDKVAKRLNLFSGRYFGLSLKTEKKILQLAESVRMVFIDSSRYGRLAKKIKQRSPATKVIVFFHNIEYFYAVYEYEKHVIKKLFRSKILFYNEKWACDFADSIIALNQRDAKTIQTLFGRRVDAVIPISMKDSYRKPAEGATNNLPVGLFIGVNFYANTRGISWFIENVLPKANMKLVIAGKGMDAANLPDHTKLKVLGYVEDLNELISQADFMIFPIFTGGGMKVKTCESLMHGKNIIGTEESFEGYDLEYDRVGCKCANANEFISAINSLPNKFPKKYNDYSRKIYLNKYSIDATQIQFNSLLMAVLR